MVTEAQAELDPREHLGRDIALTETSDMKINTSDDFALIKWQNNLKQAMLNVLRTARGELVLHPDYGSRLHEVLGTNPNDETLIIVKSHVREALLQEPRIDTIDEIKVSFRDELKKEIDVEVTVTPIYDLNQLNMVFRLFIQGTIVGGPN